MLHRSSATIARNAALFCLSFGCSAKPAPGDPQPPATTSETSTGAPTAAETVPPRAPISTETASPTATTTSPASRPPIVRDLEKRFLPQETACKGDADCAVTERGLDPGLFCCDSCGAVAGTKAWVKRADAQCAAYRQGKTRHPCPPRDCAPAGPARCNAGACEIAP